MTDSIYMVGPESKRPTKVDAIPFAKVGIRERQDLERWVIDNPGILGEDFLVITSEFCRFDRSKLRLDLLALDKNGALTVIELKLDASGSLADLQAIRYAAFCSTMMMDDVVKELAGRLGCSEDEASQKTCEFLNCDELPELDDRPRIVLAAGSIDDQELTSTVLWLRGFGVNISCVELTPYMISDAGHMVLVPRVIIPVPEARDYIVSVERKEARQVQHAHEQNDYQRFWKAVSAAYNNLGSEFHAPEDGAKGQYLRLHIGKSHAYYLWALRKNASRVDACLDTRFDDQAEMLQWLALIESHAEYIKMDIPLEFTAKQVAERWTEVAFRVEYDGTFPGMETAIKAAETMKILVERTYSILRSHLGR